MTKFKLNRCLSVFFFTLLLVIVGGNSASGQEVENKPTISFSGYIKGDYIIDSRQTISAREGHLFLFPRPASLDDNDNDLNAKPNFNILGVQSRLTVKASGPDFFSMKTSGMIEGDFLGQSEADINGLRLRLAFLTLSNEKIEILMGQFWHPMLILSCYPKVYSFNTGAPFQPTSRDPQLRFSTKGDLKFIATLLSQRDFSSPGPDGTSSVYLRNAFIPNLNISTQYSFGNITTGVAIDYKTLKPRLSIFNTKTNETVTGLSGLLFFKYMRKNFEIRTQAIYGNNLPDHLMIGGYAETKYNPLSKEVEYLPFTVYSVWTDISGTFTNGEWGLFGGFTENLGLKEPLAGDYYTLGGVIDNVWRIAPRIAWVKGKTKIGLEIESTGATFGSLNIGKKEINTTNVDPVINIRGLMFGMYSF